MSCCVLFVMEKKSDHRKSGTTPIKLPYKQQAEHSFLQAFVRWTWSWVRSDDNKKIVGPKTMSKEDALDLKAGSLPAPYRQKLTKYDNTHGLKDPRALGAALHQACVEDKGRATQTSPTSLPNKLREFLEHRRYEPPGES